MDQTTKLEKQEWVSGLNGGTWFQTLSPLAVAYMSFALNRIWSRENDGWKRDVILTFVTIVIPIITSLLIEDVTGLLYLLVLALGLSFGLRTCYPSSPPSQRIKGLDAHRCLTILLTCIAILAVDTKHFPRWLAKTENRGLSLMDLGVGTMVWSGGLHKKRSVKWSHTVLLVFSLLRIFLTYILNYQSHDTEYGTHWNFFLTLWLVNFTSNQLPWPVLLAFHQLILQWEPWFLSLPRGPNFWLHNREGIVSFLGYASIHRLASSTPTDSKGLYIWSFLLFMFLGLLTRFQVEEISRRWANAPYVLMVGAVNSGLLALLQSLPNPGKFFNQIGKKQLLAFVVANLSTGIVNLTLQGKLLKMGWIEAWMVLFWHVVVITSVTSVASGGSGRNEASGGSGTNGSEAK